MRVYEGKIVYSLVRLGDDATVDKPERVAAYMRDAFEANPLQEAVWVIAVDRKNHPIARFQVTVGTISQSLIGMPEVFRPLILCGATAFIVTHNHPSGHPEPSAADLRTTRTLREAAKIMGIDLLDHVIVGDPETDPSRRGYYSLREAGLI